MPAYVVQQPDGRLAFFSTVIDDFEVTGLDDEEMEELLAYHFGVPTAREKIRKGRADELAHYYDGARADGLARWLAALEHVLLIQGEERFQQRLSETAGASPYPEADLEGRVEGRRLHRRLQDIEDDAGAARERERLLARLRELEPKEEVSDLSWEDVVGS